MNTLIRTLANLFFIFSCHSIFAFTNAASTLTPANSDASAEAKAVLAYLANLPAQKSQKLISGQFESWGRDVKPLDDAENHLNQIYQATGKWVGLMGIEYHNGGIFPEKPNKAAVNFWQQGGLIQLYLIMDNPSVEGHESGKTCDIDLVLKKGHPYNIRFFNELDEIAKGLQVLKDNHVVVFLNPYAEMTANWFWWGGQDPEKFKRLYHATFDYLVKDKGLNNLLFIFEPSAQHTSALLYYPGNDVVDMVGISIFVNHDEQLTKSKLPMYKSLLTLGKPMAFSQWGPRRGKDQTGKDDQPPADNLKLLQAIKTSFPEICWWMNWSQAYAIASTQNTNINARQLLTDPIVINRDDLTWKNYLPAITQKTLNNLLRIDNLHSQLTG